MVDNSREQGVQNMYDYFLEYANNGLTYNPHRYDADTHDEEFNEAIVEFLGSMSVLETIFNRFESELNEGKYDKYI